MSVADVIDSRRSGGRSEGKSPDIARARAEADRVLKENSVLSPPVYPLEIANNYGINVVFASFPEEGSAVMGFCDFAKNKIYVNDEDPPNRQTFTIAHEMGHMFLHRAVFEKDSNKYQVLMRAPMGAAKDPLEREANIFAANLLVPRRFLDLYRDVAGIPSLARMFMVSEEVIRYRLRDEYGL